MAALAPAGPERPSGNVAPDVDLDGVTEIRVHGVGGTTPQDLLGDPSPQLVAGDRIAGFYRTADRGGRHVEGYSWSGLTSRSSWRVLWLLLLPFMLANLAGWMALPRPGAAPGDVPTTWAFRWAARLAALAVTVDVLIMIMLLSLDVLAYQCGGQPACATSAWWLSPLTWDGLPDHPGRRLVLGAATPLLLVGIFALLSYRSRRRYEAVAPPGRAGAETGAPPAVGAAALPGGLRHGDFWAGATSHARLSRLHLSAALACVALVLCHCASATAQAWPTGPAARSAWWLTWVLGVAVLVAVVVLLAVEAVPRWLSVAVLAAAGAATALAVGFAWSQPPTEDLLAQLPGMRWAANTTWGAILLVGLAPLLLVVAVQPRARAVWRRVRGQEPVRFPGAFRWGAPFVVVTLGIVLLDVVLLGVLVAVAQLLGSIVWEPVDVGAVVDPRATSAVIHVFPVVQVSTTWLTLGTLAILVAFGAVQLVRCWRAGRGQRALDALGEDYPGGPTGGAPRTPAAWQVSALQDTSGKHPSAWVRTVARWRFLARSTTSLSYLLTSIVVAAVLAVVVFEVGVWGQGDRVSPVATAVGVTIATAIPPALVLLMRRAWTQPDRRRLIAILWDVGTFWPRSFHPFAPPSYSERAVPELLRRIWWLHDNGGRVLLASHSQGTVLAAAAVLRRSPRNDDGAEPEVGLVTFGSPLRKLYTWSFPAYLGEDVLGGLGRGEGGLGPVRWRNYSYPTDLIGGPVLSGPNDVDVRLADPPTNQYLYGQPKPPVGGHSGYWTDPRMWQDVDALAERLRRTGVAAGVPVQRA